MVGLSVGRLLFADQMLCCIPVSRHTLSISVLIGMDLRQMASVYKEGFWRGVDGKFVRIPVGSEASIRTPQVSRCEFPLSLAKYNTSFTGLIEKWRVFFLKNTTDYFGLTKKGVFSER